MKFCPKCGSEVSEGALFCPVCGARLNEVEAMTIEVLSKEQTLGEAPSLRARSRVLRRLARVFMIIFTVFSGFILFPLLWTIPMTKHYIRVTEAGQDVSKAFKILSLIFVSVVAGILMLIDN